jgi:hypothetical protein
MAVATISLGMIVKDEALVIERILSHAKTFCDEMIVVDTGSTDETVAIAESLGAKVFHFPWIDDFSAARNEAFSHCTGDWMLWLDADDVIPEADQAKFRALKAEGFPDDVDVIICSYNIAFAPDGSPTMSIPRERLIRRGCKGQWEYPIHESFVFEGYYSNRLDIVIEHHKPEAYHARCSDRNLNMLARLIEQGSASPRIWYYYGKELSQHGRTAEACKAFEQHVALNLDDKISRYQAMHDIMQCQMALGNNAEALRWGGLAIEVDSSRAEALVELGVLHFREGHYHKAVPMLNAALHCTRPTTGLILEENYTWRPLHYLSLSYEGRGDFPKAIETALKAFATIPDKQVIRDNIACFAAKL